MPPTDGARSALVIATNKYHDTTLRKLRAPARDAENLAAVLGDPSIGGFEVKTLLDQPSQVLVEEIEGFFAERRRSDLLVLYFSCHGVKDDDGRLYFATMNTRRARLASTGVAADWVNQQMSRSRSSRVVLLLDCCYSGAFARGMKGDATVGIGERFEGRGRVILTASNAVEYAFEGDDVSGAGQPSYFTQALVEGLRSGSADRDHDGLISVDELYDYVYDRVVEATRNQTPGKWALGVEGELYVAKSGTTGAELPRDLEEAVGSPSEWLREAAVTALAQVLARGDGEHTASARAALTRLESDQSPRVSQLAAEALRQQAASPSAGRPARPVAPAARPGAGTESGSARAAPAAGRATVVPPKRVGDRRPDGRRSRSAATALASVAALVTVLSLAFGFLGVSRYDVEQSATLDCGSAFMPKDSWPECSAATRTRRITAIGGGLAGVALAGGAVVLWRSTRSGVATRR